MERVNENEAQTHICLQMVTQIVLIAAITWMPKMARSGSRPSALSGPDTDHLLDRSNEHPAVANFPCACFTYDGFNFAPVQFMRDWKGLLDEGLVLGVPVTVTKQIVTGTGSITPRGEGALRQP
jgi:hypothetical protein